MVYGLWFWSLLFVKIKVGEEERREERREKREERKEKRSLF